MSYFLDALNVVFSSKLEITFSSRRERDFPCPVPLRMAADGPRFSPRGSPEGLPLPRRPPRDTPDLPRDPSWCLMRVFFSTHVCQIYALLSSTVVSVSLLNRGFGFIDIVPAKKKDGEELLNSQIHKCFKTF